MKRARNDNEKLSRREDILGAAAALFEENSFRNVTMAALAEKAKIAKGTVFLYFKTKESVYLTLLEQMLDAWAQEMLEELPRLSGGFATTQRALALVTSSFSSPGGHTMMRLLGILEPILMQNVPRDRLASFRSALTGHVELVGKALEKTEPALEPGAGSRLVLEMLGAAIGIAQISKLVTPGEPNESTRFTAPLLNFDSAADALLRGSSRLTWGETASSS